MWSALSKQLSPPTQPGRKPNGLRTWLILVILEWQVKLVGFPNQFPWGFGLPSQTLWVTIWES